MSILHAAPIMVEPRPSAARRPRIQRRPLHGVLLLDKPLGLSSNEALQTVRRLLRAEKAGHAGTLDPLASGLLPICLGAATKFSQAGLDADKGYRATLRLGLETTSGDAEGDVVSEQLDAALGVGLDQVRAVLQRFEGEIEQLPPMHSALKKDGKALYEYAREGLTVEREPRRVRIHSIDVISFSTRSGADHPLLVLDVRCTKGTYIRTLAADIGRALGCGASLAGLRRTASGASSLEQAISLNALAEMDEPTRMQQLQPVDALIAQWPSVVLNADDAARFLTGLRRRTDHAPAMAVRVFGPDGRSLLGTASIKAGELIPQRLLSPVEVAQCADQFAATSVHTNTVS